MTKFTKAPKVKKYLNANYIRIITSTFVFNSIIELNLIYVFILKAKKGLFPNENLEFSSL